MAISRVVPNVRSDRPAETRDFFVRVLGFDVAMDLGWVMTVASPTNPSARVTIVGNDDMAAPGISVEVDDVDAAHAMAVDQGLEIAYPLRDEEWGGPALHASRAERHDRQRLVSSLGLSARRLRANATAPRLVMDSGRSAPSAAARARSGSLPLPMR
jgi:catechol 2,3-dioxygenase-like lactoylglutathione lyase family enzyme